MAGVNRYPDDNATYLKEKLSIFLGVSVENVMLGHGSNELIRLLVEVVMEPGDEAIMADPSFVVYPRAVLRRGRHPRRARADERRKHDLDAMLEAVTERRRSSSFVIPTTDGNDRSKEELEEFSKSSIKAFSSSSMKTI